MASQASTETTPSPKQLVFLFMASTVVAVVVFLCGVLMGRGVPARETMAGPSFSGLGTPPSLDENELGAALPDVANGGASAAARSEDDLSYSRRLGSREPFTETLRDGVVTEAPVVSEPAGDVSVESPRPTPNEETAAVLQVDRARAPEPDTRPRVSVAPGEASSVDVPAQVASTTAAQGYTVQVAALRASETAQQIAARLVTRGFPAYVLDPAPDAPVAVYRVRVGRYADHGEADRIRQRLEQEEQFNPWITR